MTLAKAYAGAGATVYLLARSSDEIDRAAEEINNAGTGHGGVLEGFTMDQVSRIFDINALGALRVDKAVLPSMRERGAGLLVHVSSTGGRVLVPFVAPYSAAKAALEALAEELSFELGPFGVESVIVEPGSFGTEAFGKLISPASPRRRTYGLFETA